MQRHKLAYTSCYCTCTAVLRPHTNYLLLMIDLVVRSFMESWTCSLHEIRSIQYVVLFSTYMISVNPFNLREFTTTSLLHKFQPAHFFLKFVSRLNHTITAPIHFFGGVRACVRGLECCCQWGFESRLDFWNFGLVQPRWSLPVGGAGRWCGTVEQLYLFIIYSNTPSTRIQIVSLAIKKSAN